MSPHCSGTDCQNHQQLHTFVSEEDNESCSVLPSQRLTSTVKNVLGRASRPSGVEVCPASVVIVETVPHRSPYMCWPG